MNLIFVVLAVLCGLALIFQFDTGTLEAQQVAGLGIIFAALAALSPVSWPWQR
jgi:hypothetical protein